MEWVDCPESSNITRFGYDQESQRLLVEFHSGATYEYFDVPEPTFAAMRTADSKGQYLTQSIKGNYRYARM